MLADAWAWKLEHPQGYATGPRPGAKAAIDAPDRVAAGAGG